MSFTHISYSQQVEPNRRTQTRRQKIDHIQLYKRTVYKKFNSGIQAIINKKTVWVQEVYEEEIRTKPKTQRHGKLKNRG